MLKRVSVTTDGVNFSLHGCTVKFLTPDDVIQPGDFVRDLVESNCEGGFNTSFKRDEWRGLRWHLASEDLHGWVGRTYHEFLLFCNNGQDVEVAVRHELARVL